MITWTCMVCGNERPDHLISVYTERQFKPFEMSVNIRYCNDNIECIQGAGEHDLLKVLNK